MCWVMPPASCSITLALRMASRGGGLPGGAWAPVGVGGGGGEARLPVVDVAHDGDDGGARAEGAGGVVPLDEDLLDVLLADLHLVAELLAEGRRRGVIDHLVDRGHLAHLHELLDDLGGLEAQLVG